MSTIEELLQANEDLRLEQGFDKDKEDARRSRINARLEEVFPGLAEDETTRSGIYEPDRKHFPSNFLIHRPSWKTVTKYDFNAIPEDSKTQHGESRHEYGTGPELTRNMTRSTPEFPDSPMTHSEISNYFNRHLSRASREDLDFATPDFATDRADRTYGGFEPGITRNPYQVGSAAYWAHIDKHNDDVRRLERGEPDPRWERQHQRRLRRERSQRSARARGRRPIDEAADGAIDLHTTNAGARRHSAFTRTTFSSRSGAPQFGVGRSHHSEDLDMYPHRMSFVNRAIREGVHTIYSYDTPIAWRENYEHQGGPRHRWILDESRYSHTSGRHREAIRSALNRNGYYSAASSHNVSVYMSNDYMDYQPTLDSYVQDWRYNQTHAIGGDQYVSEHIRRMQEEDD
jgi:hypothetical protein